MFNKESRLKNLALSSSFGVAEQMLVYILSFVYRTVFLMVLSKEYLGISGLFTNILQIFSLTELGIGSVIAYRLYKPIKEDDAELCHALMNFYKKIYQLIALIVFGMGCVFFPFLNSIIADVNEIPADVNLSIIYWLYVFQSVASYLFVYAQSLLIADQKNYVISFTNSIYNVISTILKILILVLFKSYTYSLFIGIVVNVVYNYWIAAKIKGQYKAVYEGNQRLNRNQKAEIFKDTASLMCHKVGYVVLNSTDSIILSKYIGVAILGIYSNYSMISTAIDAVLNKMLGSFVSTIGNLSLENNKENTFYAYKRLLFVNFWLVSFCTIAFFSLVNPFITIWLDKSYVLDQITVIILTCNMFFNSSGIINSVFTNANGLFIKDRIRPLIQSLVNLIVSIYLVQKIGLPGIFVGTLVSNLFTTWWRQPLILFRYVFCDKPIYYFSSFIKWFAVTICICLAYKTFFDLIPISFLSFILYLIIVVIFTNVLFWVLFRKDESYLYCKELVLKKIKKH